MAVTPSSMVALGFTAPDFSLKNTEQRVVSLSSVQGERGTLVIFLCNHCPYVLHIREVLATVTAWALENKIGVVGINSNDIEKYPEDSPEKMKIFRERYRLPFDYLFDSTQNVAKTYRAACTPDFFLFDKKNTLVYRGQFDDSRPSKPSPVTGADLKSAMRGLIEGKPISTDQRPSIGCNIKWKSGNEPGASCGD